MEKVDDFRKFRTIWPVRFKPRQHFVVNPERERALAVLLDAQRLAVLDPLPVPGDQVVEKTGITVGIAAGRDVPVPGRLAPSIGEANQIFPRGGLNGRD